MINTNHPVFPAFLDELTVDTNPSQQPFRCPLIHLEPVSRKQEILPYIESLHRELKIPVIHVSHLPDEVAQFADFVVLIGSGGVLASGDVNEVFTRLDLPPAHDSDASSLVEAQVCGHDADYHLTRLAFPGGELLVALRPLAEGQKVRLRLAARDVSLTLQRQSGSNSSRSKNHRQDHTL